MDYTQADLAKMESGKLDLPIGLTRNKSSYRIYHTVFGRKYNFGSIQDLKLAIKTNQYITRLVNDYREELQKKADEKEQLKELLTKNSIANMQEITRQIESVKATVKQQNDVLEILADANKSLVNRLVEKPVKNTFWGLFSKGKEENK